LEGAGQGTAAMGIGHLALAHALAGDVRRAARLFGFWVSASNALRVTREFTEQTTYDRLCAILGERLSASERAALVATGSAFSLHDAIVEACTVRARTEPAIPAPGVAAVNRQGVNA
jgi:hypothetical protein